MSRINASRDTMRSLLETGGMCATSSDRTNPMYEFVRITTRGARMKAESACQTASVRAYADADTVTEDVSFCVLKRDLSECLEHISDAIVTIDADIQAHSIGITHAGGRMVLPCVDASDFPEFTNGGSEDEMSVTLPTETVASWMKKAKPFASTDDLRPVMCGMRLAYENGALTASASDGRILFYDEKPVEEPLQDFSVIIPTGVMPMVSKVIERTDSFVMRCDGRKAWFSASGVTLCVRLVEGRYPNFRSVIPAQHSSSAKVRKDDLKSAMKRVELTASTSSGACRFAFAPEELKVTSENLDVARSTSERMGCEGDSDTVIGFSCRFLAKITDAVDGESMVFRMNGGTKAAVVAEDDPDSRKVLLIMPMNMNA